LLEEGDRKVSGARGSVASSLSETLNLRFSGRPCLRKREGGGEKEKMEGEGEEGKVGREEEGGRRKGGGGRKKRGRVI